MKYDYMHVAMLLVTENANDNKLKIPTLDTMLEEMAELILAYRGKHEHAPSVELIEIGGIVINLLRIELQKEVSPQQTTAHSSSAEGSDSPTNPCD